MSHESSADTLKRHQANETISLPFGSKPRCLPDCLRFRIDNRKQVRQLFKPDLRQTHVRIQPGGHSQKRPSHHSSGRLLLYSVAHRTEPRLCITASEAFPYPLKAPQLSDDLRAVHCVKERENGSVLRDNKRATGRSSMTERGSTVMR